MHNHDFVGAQSIYTRAILANKKINMHDYFGGHRGEGGGAPSICGGHVSSGPP